MGDYSRWLKVSEGPYIVSVAAENHSFDLVSGVVIVSQGTTTVDFELRLLEACVSAVPPELVVDVPLGYDKTVLLDVLNAGAVSSALKISEKPAPAGLVADILWDQPLSTANTAAYVDQDFTDMPTYSSWLADDFTNADPWAIYTFFVPGDGWNGFSDLLNADSLTWSIYADAGGVPDGDPSGNGIPPVWTITLAPDDPQVTISTGSGGYNSDATLNLDDPALLDAGTYWLVFYPSGAFSGFGQYGRQPADTTNNYTGQFINPGGGFGFGADWQDWTVLGVTQPDIAFRLEGELGNQDIPWLAEDPITGTVGHDSNFPVDVTFTTFPLTMTVGDVFTGSLIIKNDDPANPKIVVPVTMNVVAPVYGVAMSADQVGSGEPGDVITYTVTVTNTSNFATDSFNLTFSGNVYVTTLSTAVVGPLAIGESATFVVTVTIPDDALAGDQDTVQITATSVGDPAPVPANAQVDVTTNVFVTIKNVYLPLVWKAP
jgi:hypothetical protein